MIECINVCIEQDNFLLENISVAIEKETYVVLMGKTGSGKTTLLEAICGLRKIKGGQILLDKMDISKLSPGQRGIGYVPQDGALFTTMTVAQNIGFALKIRKWSPRQIDVRVKELAAILEINHLLERGVQNLSGGEKQRVALGRALSFYPKFLCLDEPLSALDDSSKARMYNLLLHLKKSLKLTILHVSHSKFEADKLADRILQLHGGEVVELS
ncbi:ABC transporter ATP-binding protein [Cellulophaga sp. F20128]|uniref:ATP-binding cassette domain-containing protein n=1 Tax=Cellulophaga sp. F20128 TaxID=2926413 RepID=UPI001FF49F28|nr:ABC transporter ATP-binding protein [Cellulophaga sp. F20128]MCK0158053.1 ABC transporter ATP-binding protein [Cellulophaga sp. F20128]